MNFADKEGEGKMKITGIKKLMFERVIREAFDGSIYIYDDNGFWLVNWAGFSQRTGADARTYADMLEKAARIADFMNEYEIEVDRGMIERTFLDTDEKERAVREAKELIGKNWVKYGLNTIFNF